VCVHVCVRARAHVDVTVIPLQEQCCRQGDESLLQKALDESRRESQSGTEEVSYTNVCVCVSVCVCLCVC